MCEAKGHPNYYRCHGSGKCDYTVNHEGHERFAEDVDEELHFRKKDSARSPSGAAVRQRRSRANKACAEVDAMRTVHRIPANAPLGPVLRSLLHSYRRQGAALSLIAMARQFRFRAAQEGVTVEEVAERYQNEQIEPHRMRAGERLADLVEERPDWVDEQYLVRMIEPPENGTPNKVFLRVVRDLDSTEWLLLTSFDGSEPRAYPNDTASLKIAAAEAISRVRAISEDPAAYEAWLAAEETSSPSPWTRDCSTPDFLANTDSMHLL